MKEILHFNGGGEGRLRELTVSGWWVGDATYICDSCRRAQTFSFQGEEIDSRRHRQRLRKQGWRTARADGELRDFCCEECQRDFFNRHSR